MMYNGYRYIKNYDDMLKGLPMDQDTELLKGNTQMLILAVLREEPMHGYAIAREIERQSGNDLKFRDGTLYPALQQLEAAGMIVGAWEPTEKAPPRKVYRLTDGGRAELQRRVGVWSRFENSINTIIGVGPKTRPI
jgi:PadR family transcriptional regulator PadR